MQTDYYFTLICFLWLTEHQPQLKHCFWIMYLHLCLIYFTCLILRNLGKLIFKSLSSNQNWVKVHPGNKCNSYRFLFSLYNQSWRGKACLPSINNWIRSNFGVGWPWDGTIRFRVDFMAGRPVTVASHWTAQTFFFVFIFAGAGSSQSCFEIELRGQSFG